MIYFKLKGNYQTRQIWLNDKILNPIRSLRKINHSPSGFAWGYNGSGPAQLALAILLELIPEDHALEYYQSFKDSCIAALPQTDFELILQYDDE